MKKAICLLLVLILLCGCSKEAQPAQTLPTPWPAATQRYTEPEDPAERLAWRRDLVEAEMREMMTFLWTPQEEIVYDYGDGAVTLKPGRIYEGMPYTHGSAGGDSFLCYATGQDERGVYTISGMPGEALSGGPGAAFLGNDCADALYWAWATVSNSITFASTNRMTAHTGCIPVGEYVCSRLSYNGSTKVITKENGQAVMLASYAQMQKGDGMVYYTDEKHGHAMMVCSVVVVYDQEGQIDPANSYVRILDQNGIGLTQERTRFHEDLGQEVYTLCGVDRKLTFDALYSGGYLPVTCQELIDPTYLEEEQITDSLSQYSAESLLSGSLKTNYRISHVEVSVCDESGQVVQNAIGFGAEQFVNSYKLMQFRNTQTGSRVRGEVDLQQLPPGTYRCVITCTLSTGRILVARDYWITK